MSLSRPLVEVEEKKKSLFPFKNSFVSLFKALKIRTEAPENKAILVPIDKQNSQVEEIGRALAELKFIPRVSKNEKTFKNPFASHKSSGLKKTSKFVAPFQNFYLLTLPDGCKITIKLPSFHKNNQPRELKPITEKLNNINDINLKWVVMQFPNHTPSLSCINMLEKMEHNPNYFPLHLCLNNSCFQMAKELVFSYIYRLYKLSDDTLPVLKLFMEFISKQNEEGNLPLNLAFKKNAPDDVISFFYYAGCSPCLADGTENGDTAMHLAARTGNAKFLMIFLKKFKPDIMNCCNKKGRTPLMEAMDHIKNMDALLQIIELMCWNGLTPEKSSSLSLNTSFKCGCQSNMYQDGNKMETPLHVAVQFGHLKLAARCLDKHSTCDMVNAYNRKGQTPILEALKEIKDKKKLIPIIELLCKRNANLKLMTTCDEPIDVHSILASFEEETTDNEPSVSNFQTVFHIALENKALDAVKTLIAARKNQWTKDDPNFLNTKDRLEHTPLHILASINDPKIPERELLKIAKLLLKNGASPKEKDYWNDKMPFQLTVSKELHKALYPLSLLDDDLLMADSTCWGPCASHKEPIKF